MTRQKTADWHAKRVRDHYKKIGVEIGELDIIVQTIPVIGFKFVSFQPGRPQPEKQFTPFPVAHQIQAIMDFWNRNRIIVSSYLRTKKLKIEVQSSYLILK